MNKKSKEKGFTLAECATHVDMSNGYRKTAFTLAEVLITLGIIGVVAAITIPNLINKIYFIQFASAMKKEYSQFVNTIRFLSEENSREYECYAKFKNWQWTDNVKTGCNDFWRDYYSQRKMASECEVGDYSCRPRYKERQEILNNGGRVACGLPTNEVKGHILLNGVTYYVWDTNFNNGTAGIQPQYFVIDLNGKKGPNKYGYDVHYFTIVKNNDDFPKIGQEGCYAVEKDGLFLSKMIKR